MAKRLITLDYDAVRTAFDEEFRATRKLIESGETHLDNLAEGFTEADRVLWQMSTADAVEVVRCAQCKHFGRNAENDTYCSAVNGLSDPEPADFCSYGERKGGQAPQREDV